MKKETENEIESQIEQDENEDALWDFDEDEEDIYGYECNGCGNIQERSTGFGCDNCGGNCLSPVSF